ncbi:MAG: hypothetical protein ABJ004_04840 [Cyclobacteriaceae bacterium]
MNQLAFFILLVISFVWTIGFGQNGSKAYRDAEDFLYSGKYKDALAAYSYASDHPTFEYKTTICKFMLGRDGVTLDTYQEFESAMTHSPVYYFWLGKFFLKDAEYEKAKDAFHEFLSLSPNHHEGDRLKAQVSFLVGYLDEYKDTLAIERLPAPINTNFPEPASVTIGNGTQLFASQRITKGVYSLYKTHYGTEDKLDVKQYLGMTFDADQPISLIPGFGNVVFVYDPKSAALQPLILNADDISKGQPIAPGHLQNVRHCYISQNKTKVIFSKQTEANGLDLFETIYLRTSQRWTDPVPLLGKVNTPYDEDFPYIGDDRGTLYFSSNRPGGLGKMDVYYSKVDKSTYQWKEGVNAGLPINTIDDEIDFKVFAGGKGSFCSDRNREVGNFDVFSFHTKP